MPGRRYEFRVTGRLSEPTRHAFAALDTRTVEVRGVEIRDVPAETVISADVADDDAVHAVLGLIQSLGLEVVSIERMPGPVTRDG
ncbi:hypothetical protein BJF78_08540 [Pseudonocardia sp. CNS-139]|nr:hypothetical protein BJF78_08540 [Pseudonocardia sp. CNS-139]